ncbi:MAG: hypothetical protein QW299_02695 [Candidatus Caldarchaeum sp.]
METFFKNAMAERRLAEANMAAALQRRLMWLQIDEERPINNTPGSQSVVIYDMSALGSVYLKTVYSLVVLNKLYYDAMSEGQSLTLKKLVIAEECQNYVRGSRFDEPPSIGERVVNELRAYGVGVIMISPDPVQIPWHTARDVAAIVAIGLQAVPDVFRDIFQVTTYACSERKHSSSTKESYTQQGLRRHLSQSSSNGFHHRQKPLLQLHRLKNQLKKNQR